MVKIIKRPEDQDHQVCTKTGGFCLMMNNKNTQATGDVYNISLYLKILSRS